MLGVFGISWRAKPFSPSEEQLSFLEQYAFLAAVALEKIQVKVQLREELKRSEEQQIDPAARLRPPLAVEAGAGRIVGGAGFHRRAGRAVFAAVFLGHHMPPSVPT